jgi:diguanylate cyclase (GGDEF)-like protein
MTGDPVEPDGEAALSSGRDGPDHDELTGLLSRDGLHGVLSREVARARRSDRWLSVAAIDLDGFKMVNDEWGHRAGDAVLLAVAQRLASAVRPSDAVGRLGGDEFGLVLPETEAAEAVAVVERVLVAIAAPIDVDGGSVAITASAGVARPRPDDPEGAVWAYADKAVFYAKVRGPGRVEVARKGLTATLREAYRDLEHRARFDARTKLRNAATFAQDHQQLHADAAASRTSYGLLLADVDFFHDYNRHHGIRLGDETLALVAEQIERACPDGTVYRYGGEEFVALLPGASPRAAAEAAERLRSSVEQMGREHAARSDGGGLVTITVAAAVGAGDESSRGDVIDAADALLTAAKDSGHRNCAVGPAG